MAEITVIVNKLKQEPFNFNDLTVITFSEKTPEELIQLTTDVFSKFLPALQGLDTTQEAPEVTAGRLQDFLRYVKYRSPHDELTYRQGLANGDSEVIYPALKFVLSAVERNEKRAYVGYYLDRIEIPAEYQQDEEIMELMNQSEDLKQQFTQTHIDVEALRKTFKDPASVKEQINQLEDEKVQLAQRINLTKGKVSSKVTDKSELTELSELATSLRKEQEKEMDQQQAIHKEHQKRQMADQKYQRAAVRLREIRASLASGNSSALLTQLAEEVSSNRYIAQEKLPLEIERKTTRIRAVRSVMHSAINTESDLASWTEQKRELDLEVRELEEARNAAMNAGAGDMQLRQQQQVAKSVAAKKAAIDNKRDKLLERKKQVTSEYDSSAMRAEENKAAAHVPKGEDWKQKYEAVKGKLVRYKKMKKVLDSLNMEAAVLARTESILEEQARNVMGAVAEEEQRAGVAGFASAQETLEQVSQVKGAIDEEKGNTLEEISHFVQKINSAIKDRKSKLAPQIKELRAVRHHFQELEGEHDEKKKVYEAASMGYESKRAKLEAEVKQYKAEVGGDEGKYHYINIVSAVTDAHIKRVTSGAESAAVKEDYHRRVEEGEELTKKLKMRQKQVKDNFEPNLGQIELLKDLHRLMEVKLRTAKKGNVGDMLGGQDQVMGGANVLSM